MLALAACGAAGPSGGGDDEGNGPPSTDFRWSLTVTTTFEEIKGTTSTISGDSITGTDSTPAGWSLELSRPGGFVEEAPYASFDDPASGVEADLTVTIMGPDGSSCTVGPGNTSISEDGPEPGDTLAQATYFGTDETDGRPIVSFASLWSACDDLPGASGSGTVDIWVFGFGSP
ncbi:MAG: hypothetical protein ABR510_09860 [Trueperaceae bacterium]